MKNKTEWNRMAKLNEKQLWLQFLIAQEYKADTHSSSINHLAYLQ